MNVRPKEDIPPSPTPAPAPNSTKTIMLVVNSHISYLSTNTNHWVKS